MSQWDSVQSLLIGPRPLNNRYGIAVGTESTSRLVGSWTQPLDISPLKPFFDANIFNNSRMMDQIAKYCLLEIFYQSKILPFIGDLLRIVTTSCPLVSLVEISPRFSLLFKMNQQRQHLLSLSSKLLRGVASRNGRLDWYVHDTYCEHQNVM